MCLGEIVRLEDVAGPAARARLGERVLSVSLVTLEETVAAGDWVVVHSGFALRRLEPAQAAEALALRAGTEYSSVPPVSPNPSPPTHPRSADHQEES